MGIDDVEKGGTVLGWVKLGLTIAGTLTPFVLAIFAWGAGINNRIAEHTIRIEQQERETTRIERQIESNRSEIMSKLDKIANQIEQLQSYGRAK